MKRMLAAVALPLLAAAACTASAPDSRSVREPMVEDLHRATMIVVDRPPVIAVLSPVDLPVAERAASRIDRAGLAARGLSRRVAADALPFLTETRTGLEFLAAAPPRALARGMPPEYCPAVAAVAGAPGAAPADIAVRALRSCLDRLPADAGGCGCRIMALDDLLLVPREDTAYATGTSARMQAPALGLDLLLVAEEEPGHPALLRDLNGTVARVIRSADGSVVVELTATGQSFTGFSVPVGFRRGRVAERIYATDSAGNRIAVLIGFEPGELANGAAAWMAWPQKG